MNIATPPDIAPANGAGEKLFSLPAREFVNAWAAALDLSDDDLPPPDRENLVSSIRAGVSRLRIVAALRRRRPGGVRCLSDRFCNDIRRPPDHLVLIENLTRFAPEDDATFLRHAFDRICGRGPSNTERLEFEFDLRRGAVDRAAAIKNIVSIARREGRSALWDTSHEDAEPNNAADARVLPAGLLVNEDGRETLVFVREIPQPRQWMVGPEMMRQEIRTADDGWLVEDGWLIAGPKRTLPSGLWQVDLDILQQPTSKLEFDIVANSGLDVIQSMTIAGGFCGSLLVDLQPHHRFVELRILVRSDKQTAWLRPRNISMRRVT